MRRFKDKVAVVTGASSGLGRSISLQLSKEGAAVILLARREGLLAELAEEIMTAGGKAAFYSVDLTNSLEVKETVKAIRSEFSQVDLLVNNAGKELFMPFAVSSLEATQELFEINIISLINLTRQLLSKIRPQGSIVNIASAAGVVGAPAFTIYSATKGAIISLTRSLALELAPRRIRVNAIAPGTIKTNMTERIFSKLKEEQIKAIEQTYPLGLGTPKDVALAVAYLGSEDARWITGQTLVVDGGYSIG